MDRPHQQYPAQQPHQGHLQQQFPQDIQAKIAHIQQMKISSIKEHIDQIPNADNQMTAVCTTTILTDTMSIEQFGACTPNDIGGNQHPAALLESASKFATDKALALALAASNQASPQVIDVPVTGKSPSQRSEPQKDYSKYANNPMSGNQRRLLCKMANECGQNIETTCLQVLNKSFDSLNNENVQQLVSYFKKC